MTNDTHLKSVRLYEQVAAQIKKQIVSGAYLPGSKLPTERQIAHTYGVSRNVVREAIRALGNDGLVEVRQGSGTYLTNGTSKALGDSFSLALALGGAAGNLGDLIEIRSFVEPPIAGLAAANATPDDIVALRHELTIMGASFDDVDAFIAADHRFHLGIARATGNSLIAVILEPIVDVLFEQRSQLFYVDRSPSAAQNYHHELVEHIANGDVDAAISAMSRHMRQVKDDFRKLGG
ncbi:FadR/GntR family transcriptional regulator [Devosia algicola]|uniref:FadR/GntR family transcriptional regulator n=1 Tax=Devosia algicola TaxID=3026418 RepID=A0ABY7YL54_9HYPH|nr:FadR/GntR family transcriptional regulator [Devosia algicola]WDR01957.1 FadR/GntR family transcriptional regulator [Devosia algicola]